jgi:hypothetical protein
VVGAITGLSGFPTLENTRFWGRIAVAAAAFLAAAFPLVPRGKNYAEIAGKAREIASAAKKDELRYLPQREPATTY